MKRTILFALLVPACGMIYAQFPKALEKATDAFQGRGVSNGLSNAEVVSGLKEALEKGAGSAVDQASKADGFWGNDRMRIPFPPEAEKMKATLLRIGMEKQVKEFELTMNRAAEDASKEAAAIFISAIKGMSVGDGFAILRGGEQAATNFLKEKTTADLTTRFRPIVETATQKVSLTQHWSTLASGYNKAGMITGAKAVDPDLDAYVTQKAIDGLFLLVADEEARIRKDPLARTSDLLRRVFGEAKP
ncbi:MAG: DUF4197 domain-containing protein [Bacteroidota bacterium]|nr:DUF4197 domain-containing protein [Bacteroidota bacterium]